MYAAKVQNTLHVQTGVHALCASAWADLPHDEDHTPDSV